MWLKLFSKSYWQKVLKGRRLLTWRILKWDQSLLRCRRNWGKKNEKRKDNLLHENQTKQKVSLTHHKKSCWKMQPVVCSEKKEQELLTLKSGLNFSKKDSPSSTSLLLSNSPNCDFKISWQLWKSMSPGSKCRAKKKLQSDELAKGSNLNIRKPLV